MSTKVFRRIAIGSFVSVSLLSGLAVASTPDCSMKAFDRQNSSLGDASPTPYAIWAILNGCTKRSSKPVALTPQDVQYMRYSQTTGDGTPMPFTEFVNPSTASKEPRKLTAEEREYIRFTHTFGDGTPPSFAEWKQRSSTQMAQESEAVAESPASASVTVDSSELAKSADTNSAETAALSETVGEDS